MTNEEIEKVMNFLIQRQEIFADNLARIEQNMAGILETMTGIQETMTGIQETMAEMQGTISTLVRSQTQLVEIQTATQRDISFLARALTDLTKIVMEGRNGGA